MAMPLMTAPASGVKVRMYRQGHGDCFLLAFPTGKERPFYLLIDCGYKPGSNGKKYGLAGIRDIVNDIGAATGNHLDLVIITHEHQDHVNGIWKQSKPYFAGFEIGAAWFAWTEDPKDSLAIELRKRHHDQLLGLVAARNRMAAARAPDGEGETLRRLDDLLSLELGTDEAGSFAAKAKDPASSVNKQAMKLVKDKAKTKPKYIVPFEEILRLPGVQGVRIFAFGPPYSADLLADEDPQGAEAFPGHGFGATTRGSFFAAAQADESEPGIQPFAKRFGVRLAEAYTSDPSATFFNRFYSAAPPATEAAGSEVADNAAFRRIDNDWLYSAEDLALVLNKGINNTSLALAFELEKSRKVLLFIGDAQRGSWKSWTKGSWKDGSGKEITVRDLMARTVLYKVGHHGSHNATLAGTADDDYPNLGWMGQGSFGREFTAMITAVKDWAYAQTPVWAHPLNSIKEELVRKTAGRVFQTDTGTLEQPKNVSDLEWDEFMQRTTVGTLYFEYEVADQE